MMQRLIASWSGGKDSCLALWRAKQAGHEIAALLTMFDENGARSRSHGVRPEVMAAQAAALGLPLHTGQASWGDYETRFIATLQQLRAQYRLDGAVFGDIDLQAHRDWEEKVCAAAQLTAHLPLWQQNRLQLVKEVLDAGFEARIVTVNTDMAPAELLGQTLTHALANRLVEQGIDPAAEAGEFHTLVVNGPLFAAPLALYDGEVHAQGAYRSLDLRLA